MQVQSSYVPEKSSPADGYYFFAYTVRITNQGQETAQLVSRRWIISGPEGELAGATTGDPLAAPPVGLSDGGELRSGFVEAAEGLIAGGIP